MRYPIWRDIKISGDTEGVFYLKKNGQEVSDIGLFIRPDKDHYELFMNKLCEVLLDNNIDLENEGVYVCPEAVGTFSVEDASGNTLGSVDFRWDWSYEDLSDVRQLSFPINGHADPRMDFIYTQFNEESTDSNLIVDGKYLVLNPLRITIPSSGGTFGILVDSTVYWSAAIPLWVSPISQTYGAPGLTMFNFSVGSNTGSSMTGSITFTGESGLTASCLLSREEQRSINVSPSSISIPQSGGTFSINVSGNTSWTVSVPSWVSPVSSTSGASGTSIFQFSVGENSSVTISGDIIFSGQGGSAASCSVLWEGEEPAVGANVLLYRTDSGQTIDPYVTGYTAWTANIVSNGVWSGGSSWNAIVFDNEITSIPNYAFYGSFDGSMKSLKEVIIPSEVTSIGEEAFIFCGLSEITIPDNVTTISKSAFYNCSGATSIVFGSGLTVIDGNAFGDCGNVTSVTFSNNLVGIGDWAFQGCYSLTGVTIPDSVEYIGRNAFEGCAAMTTVTIGSGATLGQKVFRNCYRLNSITCYASTAPSIGGEVFYQVATYGTLYYPSGSDYSTWLSALPSGWIGVQI